MADAVVRLKVESQEFDNKLARATKQLQHMEKEVRRTGASFEFADKEELAFIQSLGQMETETQSLRTKMREYTESILSLTEMYQRLSDSEKNSDFGRGLLSSIDQIKQRAGELKDKMVDLDAEIKHLASDTSTFDSLAGGVNLMVSAFQIGQGALQMFGVKSEDAMEAMAKLQGAMAVTNGLTQIQNALQKQSAVMMGITTLQRKAAAAAAAIEAAAVGRGTVATKAATAAQAAFNAIANANPYVLLASAVIAVGTALFAFAEDSEAATKAEELRQKRAEIQAEKERRIAEQRKQSYAKVGGAIGEVVAKYRILKDEWSELNSNADRTSWIEKNKSAFEDLGLSINSVVDADNAFVLSSDKVIEALKARAKANALLDLYQEKVKEAYAEAGTRTQEYLDANPQYVFEKGQRIDDGIISRQKLEAFRPVSLGTGEWAGDYEIVNRYGADRYYGLTESGAKKLNDRNYQIFYNRNLSDTLAEAEEFFGFYKTANEEADKLENSLSVVDSTSQNAAENQKDSLKAVEGSIAYQREQIKKLTEQWEYAADDESREKIANEIKEANEELDRMTGKAKQLPSFNAEGISSLKQKFQKELASSIYGSEEYMIAANKIADTQAFQNLLKTAVDNGFDFAYKDLNAIFSELRLDLDVDDSTWDALVAEINAQLEALDLPKIKLDVTTGNISNVTTEVTQDAKKSTEAWQQAANAVNNLGGALNNLEDPSAKVAGIIMQAVANIALGFAQAAASPATGAAGVFGWIAAATAGLATMTATISSIKSVTKGGFANGGIVPGNSFSGDNLHTSDYGINSGELILNRSQQNVIASQLQGGAAQNMRLEALISGESLRMVLANNASRRGGNRAQYAISKFG